MLNIKDRNLFFVGGVVRDEILGVESLDTDFCYVGNAIDYARANFGSNVIKENPSFGTVRVKICGEEIDIASTRTEIYPKPGHLPVIKEIGCSLLEDLKRRDFTINAMAKNTLTDEIIDIYGGIDDIKNKKLRVLHDDSFIDDPTRIVRGLKFSVRFGFELEQHTKELQEEYLNNINYDMSYHRLKKELMETFNLDNKIAYDKFISQNIYKLLGKEQIVPKQGTEISNKSIGFQNIWIKYLANFDLSNFELTRKEMKLMVECNIKK